MWRSLVARSLGVREAGSSNLPIPIHKDLQPTYWLKVFAFSSNVTFRLKRSAMFTLKVCSTCRQEKEEDEFYRKGGGLQSKCKACQNAYHQLYYKNNKSRYIAKNRRNKNRQRQRLRTIMWEAKGRPCQDCGRSFHPWVMEFDHRDGTTKEAAVANLVSKGCTDSRLLAEIGKCDVVCANCHRLRTYHRLNMKGDLC